MHGLLGVWESKRGCQATKRKTGCQGPGECHQWWKFQQLTTVLGQGISLGESERVKKGKNFLKNPSVLGEYLWGQHLWRSMEFFHTCRFCCFRSWVEVIGRQLEVRSEVAPLYAVHAITANSRWCLADLESLGFGNYTKWQSKNGCFFFFSRLKRVVKTGQKMAYTFATLIIQHCTQDLRL